MLVVCDVGFPDGIHVLRTAFVKDMVLIRSLGRQEDVCRCMGIPEVRVCRILGEKNVHRGAARTSIIEGLVWGVVSMIIAALRADVIGP